MQRLLKRLVSQGSPSIAPCVDPRMVSGLDFAFVHHLPTLKPTVCTLVNTGEECGH
jgi:hypothetical protein